MIYFTYFKRISKPNNNFMIFFSYVFSAKDLKMRAGEWDTQTTKERLPYQERIVSRIFGHPKYNERSLANDVVSK